MKNNSLEIRTRHDPYQDFVTAELDVHPNYYTSHNGSEIFQDSRIFTHAFRLGEPLPEPIREKFGCRSCSLDEPYVSHISTFEPEKLPWASFPNQITIKCPTRAAIVKNYLEEYRHWDSNKEEVARIRIQRHDNHSPGLVPAKDPLEDLSKARNRVKDLGCSKHHFATISLEKSNNLNPVLITASNYQVDEEPNSRVAANLILGATEYIGRLQQRFEESDQLEQSARSSKTALNFTTILTKLLIQGENSYYTFNRIIGVKQFNLRDILASIDGYDILDRSYMSQNTLTIALLALNKFIIESDTNGLSSNLAQDYAFAQLARDQLKSLIRY